MTGTIGIRRRPPTIRNLDPRARLMFIPPPSPNQAPTPHVAAADPAAGHARQDAPLQLVSFNVGLYEYALPIAAVQEINRMMPITPAPLVPPCPLGIEGVINLRGRSLPLVDLRRRFGVLPGPISGEQRIIIAELSVKGTLRLLAFAVDKVNRVLRLPCGAMSPATRTDLPALAALLGIATLETGPLHVLCLEKLLDDQELAQTQMIASAA